MRWQHCVKPQRLTSLIVTIKEVDLNPYFQGENRVPLQQNHKNFIVNTIDYLFSDLPTDSFRLLELTAIIKNLLNAALLLPASKITQESYSELYDVYEPLYECLTEPDEKFRLLENEHIDKNFTESEVKLFVIEKIIEYFSDAALSCAPIVDLKTWLDSIDEIKTLWKQTHPEQIIFTSKKASPIEDPYEFTHDLPIKSDWNFSAKLIFIPDESSAHHISLRIDVRPQNRIAMHTVVIDFLPIPFLMDFTEQSAFINHAKNTGVLRAQDEALRLLINLVNLNSATLPGAKPEWFFYQSHPEAFHRLLFNNFYLNLFFKDPSQISLIKTITSNQAIEAGKIDIASVVKFSKYQLKIAITPYYHHKILQDEITAQEIIDLSENATAVLVLPSIINLQNNGTISFIDAQKIGVITATLLGNAFYSQWAHQIGSIPSEILALTLAQQDVLSHPIILELIYQKKTDVKRAKLFSKKAFTLMISKSIAPLLFNNVITADEIVAVTDTQAKILEKLDQNESLKLNLVTLKTVLNTTHSQASVLSNDAIFHLIQHKILTLEQALEISMECAFLLEKNPATLTLIKCSRENLTLEKIQFFIERYNYFYAQLEQLETCIYTRQSTTKPEALLNEFKINLQTMVAASSLTIDTFDWLILFLQQRLLAQCKLFDTPDTEFRAPDYFQFIRSQIASAHSFVATTSCLQEIREKWLTTLVDIVKTARRALHESHLRSQPPRKHHLFRPAEVVLAPGRQDFHSRILNCAKCIEHLMIPICPQQQYRP
jgi:hypothetical protein